MGSAGDRTPHIALLAFPFSTHALPLHTLARLLAAAVPDALFSFIGSAKSNAPLAAVPSPPNLSLFDVTDGCPEGFFSPNPEHEVEHYLRVCPGNLVEGMQTAAAARGGAPVTCVLSDCFLWHAKEVAEGLGVKWVALWTGGTPSLSTHVYTDHIRRSVGAAEPPLDRLLDFVPGLSAVRVRDLPEGIVFGNLDSKFHTLLHRMGLELPRAAAVVVNTFHDLEPDVVADLSTKLADCLPVGPLNLVLPSPSLADPSGCLRWLDEMAPSSVAYAAFGSIMSLPAAEMVALAEALESTGVPFLWSMSEKARAQLPEGFLERTAGKGKAVGWAPQAEVLRHPAVGAFLTHCGWNSLTEGVAGGVPMICRPFLGDQRLNARHITDVWRIGVGVDGALTKAAAEAALRDVLLAPPEGRKMRERVAVLKARAEEAVGPDGSSTANLKKLLEIVCGV